MKYSAVPGYNDRGSSPTDTDYVDENYKIVSKNRILACLEACDGIETNELKNLRLTKPCPREDCENGLINRDGVMGPGYYSCNCCQRGRIII